MDAKEAIERLNEFVWKQANGYSIHIANGGQDNDEFELLMDDLKLAISALEKVPVLEAENARLREKETPKAPKFDSGNRLCGECNEVIFNYYDYCPFCGQAIKNKE